MAFTYSPSNASARDQVRRKIGDTQAGNPVFQDEELDAILSENDSDVLLSAAGACREMAARAARGAISLTLPGISISRTSQPGELRTMADEFEKQAIQRAEPTSKVLKPQTDELLEISTGALDMDYDFAETESESS